MVKDITRCNTYLTNSNGKVTYTAHYAQQSGHSIQCTNSELKQIANTWTDLIILLKLEMIKIIMYKMIRCDEGWYECECIIHDI